MRKIRRKEGKYMELNAQTAVKGTAALSGGILGFLLGPMNGIFFALLAFVVTDYVTGVVAAIFQKTLDSGIGFRGIAKKVLIFVLVMLGNIVDQNVLSDGNAIRSTVIFFYLANEGISILENAGKLGLPYPKKLSEVFYRMKESSGKKKDF
jgi:toxin secretion/phage lysis holin